ncbi:MAG TPA: vitamin K epoxide reductase family protein [Gaiellaceae bacterium]|nr:vitamin K epoxide reductase family protein [Gaiellaceae bacterium]
MSDRRLRAAILVLSALGAGIAAYLTVARLAHVRVACATSGCETVAESHWSALGGIPVAALGLGGYLLLAATALSRSDLARALGAAAGVGGLAFALFLLWVQAAEIGAFCQWCLASDVVLVMLAPAAVLRAWRAAPPRGAPSRPARRRPAPARARRAGPAPPRR